MRCFGCRKRRDGSMRRATRSPTSSVVMPIRPASIPLMCPMAPTTASSTRWAASPSPRCSSISPTAQMAARGLALPVPAYLGADPPMGSNMETPWGLMLAPAARPSPPWMAAPRSVMMSPNMLSVTITSKRSGLRTIHMQRASTCA